MALPKQIDVGPDISAAYGTGTIIHADALRSGEHALADLDVAFSGASFSSAPATGDFVNEVHRVVAPKPKLTIPGAAFGRGTALELGLLSDPIPLIGQLSEAAAPPSTKLVDKVVGPIGIPGILRAELLRSQAQGRAPENGCVLGGDQAYGFGSVLNLEVLGGLIATNARPPRREVSQANSTTRIFRGASGQLGLRSETRETIAPVTFFQGSPFQFTVEVLGEWALRAASDGVSGDVHYGPLAASPETPVVRILGSRGQVLGQLTTQMIPLLGQHGLEITIPGIAEIVIGEDPRMIGSDASSAALATGTKSVAAVDVVRVKLLNGQLADVRIGHMEAAVSVPAGGVQCPGIQVNHEVDKPNVTPGDDFTYTIDITNPNDCVLNKLKVVERPTLPSGVKLLVLSATPLGGRLAAGVISSAADAATFPDLGPLGPGEKKTIKVKIKVPSDSLGGKLIALATAEGICPPDIKPPNDTDGPQPGIPGVSDIPVRGSDQVEGPNVGVCVVPNLKNLTYAQAKAALEAQGCVIGTVTDKPGKPEDVGKIVDQGTPPNTPVPIGTPVDVTINGPVCTVPSLAGKTPEEAKTLLEAAHCKLGTVTTDTTGKPEDAGKITTQNPTAGDKVPENTKVNVTIAPPACKVPNLSGLTEEAAKKALEDAHCKLGDVKPGPDNPDQAGKIVEQGTPADSLVPAGTTVNVTVAGPVCNVANLIGMTEQQARQSVEAQGCVLATTPKNTSNVSEVGKVTTQNPDANSLVKKGSTVNVTLGVQVLGASLERGSTTGGPGTDVSGTPTLVRTGGVALGGLALWLLISGLMTSAASSERLWRRVRRSKA